MQSKTRKLLDFMTESVGFIIPVYQRRYCWSDVECGRPFDVLLGFTGEKSSCGGKKHFLGNIMFFSRDDSYELIDGMQRLISVTILLWAVRDVACDELSDNDKRKIERACAGLVSGMRLRLLNRDAFAAYFIFSGRGEPCESLGDSKIVAAYRYFSKRFLERGVTFVRSMHDSLSGIEIIAVKLESGVDAQLNFESINSERVPLSEGDKVRNFVLTECPRSSSRGFTTVTGKESKMELETHVLTSL